MRYVRIVLGDEVWDFKASDIAHHYACFMHGDAGVCDEWFRAFDFCESSPSQLRLWATKHMTSKDFQGIGELANVSDSHESLKFKGGCAIIEKH